MPADRPGSFAGSGNAQLGGFVWISRSLFRPQARSRRPVQKWRLDTR